MRYIMSLFIILSFSTNSVIAYEEGQAEMKGAEILKPFKMNLQQALMNGLVEGPENAVSVCNIEASQITDSQTLDDIVVGRTSDQLRNPLNTSPDWVAPILAAYKENPFDRSAQEVTLGNGRVGYIEAINIQPVCLVCHGENISPSVSRQLKELYPTDKAIGYKTGDLRGAFWLEYNDQ